MEVQTPAISVGSVDVSRLIDESPLSRFQIGVFVLCALTIMIDGFDVQAITYVAPVLTDAFHVPRAMLGPVFSAGLVGTVLGALLIAPLADRIGRKTALSACIALFGVCSLITAAGLASAARRRSRWRSARSSHRNATGPPPS
jgi:AAHS family 4-hydroxybenzoate transporter-like MFS transporter